ncbi:MAG: hypothetical protein AAGG44_13220 [Planctomycetota bacterium]
MRILPGHPSPAMFAFLQDRRILGNPFLRRQLKTDGAASIYDLIEIIEMKRGQMPAFRAIKA